MDILVIKHIESEGPGTLGSYLEAQGARLRTVALHKGEGFPRDTEAVTGTKNGNDKALPSRRPLNLTYQWRAALRRSRGPVRESGGDGAPPSSTFRKP